MPISSMPDRKLARCHVMFKVKRNIALCVGIP